MATQSLLKTPHIKLNDSQREEMANKLSLLLKSSRESRRGLDQEINLRRKQYYGILPHKTKDFPFPDSANLHIPLTKWIIDNIHARLCRVILGADPVIMATPSAPSFQRQAKFLEECLQALNTSIVKMPQVVDEAVMNVLIDGIGLIKAGWRYETRNVVEIQEIQEPLMDGLGNSVMDEGNLPIHHLREKEVVTKRTVYNAPSFWIVPLSDYLMLPADATSRSNMIGEAHRYFLRRPAIEEYVRRGVFDEKAVENLTESGEYGGADSSRDPQIKEELERTFQQRMTYALSLDRRWEIHEVLFHDDIDGDRQQEYMRAWVNLPTATLLGLEYFPYWHGRSYFIPFRLRSLNYSWANFEGPSGYHGESIVATLTHLQEELNALHNQILDRGTLANAVTLLVRKDLYQDWERRNIEPGSIMAVEDPNEVKELQFSPPDSSSFNQALTIEQFAEKLTGIANPQIGIPSEGGKTAFEIGSVLEEGNTKFAQYIETIQRGDQDGGGMQELAEQEVELIHQGVYQWGAMDMIKEVMGDKVSLDDEGQPITDPQTGQPLLQVDDPNYNPFLQKTMTDFWRNLQVNPHGNTRTSNKQVEMNKRSTAYTLAMQTPVIQQDPVKQLKLLTWMLEGLDVDDPERLIGSPQELQRQMQMQAQSAAQAQNAAQTQEPSQAPPPQQPPQTQNGEAMPMQQPPQPQPMPNITRFAPSMLPQSAGYEGQ